MCNCIKEIEEKTVGGKIGDSVVQEATLLQTGFALMFSNGSYQPGPKKTHTECEMKVEGRRKCVIMNISHYYCPFCGVKIQ